MGLSQHYGIEEKEARRLLASIDRKTDCGRRDYATFIYTKIDFDTLKTAVLDWPEDEL